MLCVVDSVHVEENMLVHAVYFLIFSENFYLMNILSYVNLAWCPRIICASSRATWKKKKSDFGVSWSYHWLLKLILSTFLITSIWSDSLQIVFTRKVHSTRMFFSIGITPINNFHWSQFQSFEEVEMLQWQRLLRRMASIPDGVCFGKEIKP